MKKPKAVLTAVLYVLFLALLIPGCSKDSTSTDDNGDTHELVGTWRLSTLTVEGVTATAAQAGMSWTLTFRSNDTFTISLTMEGNTDTGSGDWSVSGRTVTIDDGDETWSFTYTMSGNTFSTLIEDFEFEDGEADVTFLFTKQ